MAAITLTCAATGQGNAACIMQKRTYTLYSVQGNNSVYLFTFYFDSATHQT